MALSARTQGLLQLIRFDKPIGTLLLMWPTLIALWLAAGGPPQPYLLFIFMAGVFLTRSAGCVINDLADRDLDGAVQRTNMRPLVTGAVSPRAAVILFMALMLLAFVLVLFTNALTIALSFVAVVLASTYPLMKRFTHLPQLVLGAAFSWGIPMAFAAQSGALPPALWLLYVANLLWTVAYDTMYAMADREDDILVGIKSSAILFGRYDRSIIAVLQISCLVCFFLVGQAFAMGTSYQLALIITAGLFIYQHSLIRNYEPTACFQAFLHNNWVGMVIFAGVVLHYLAPES